MKKWTSEFWNIPRLDSQSLLNVQIYLIIIPSYVSRGGLYNWRQLSQIWTLLWDLKALMHVLDSLPFSNISPNGHRKIIHLWNYCEICDFWIQWGWSENTASSSSKCKLYRIWSTWLWASTNVVSLICKMRLLIPSWKIDLKKLNDKWIQYMRKYPGVC